MRITNKIVFFVDFATSIGAGHISRSNLVANEFLKRGYTVDFYSALNNIPINCSTFFQKNIFETEELPSIGDARMIFVDSIRLSQSLIEKINISYPNVIKVVIDDYKRLSYSNWVIIDWTPSAVKAAVHEKNRKLNRLLLGRDYMPINFDYEKYRRNRVIIIMGGTDAFDLNEVLLRLVLNEISPSLVTVVNGNPILAERYNVSTTAWLEPSALGELLTHARFVVCGAGQTMYELTYMNIPFIPIMVHENQFEDIGSALQMNGKSNSNIIDARSEFWKENFIKEFRSFYSSTVLENGLTNLVSQLVLQLDEVN